MRFVGRGVKDFCLILFAFMHDGVQPDLTATQRVQLAEQWKTIQWPKENVQ